MWGSNNIGLGMGISTIIFALLIRACYLPFVIGNV